MMTHDNMSHMPYLKKVRSRSSAAQGGSGIAWRELPKRVEEARVARGLTQAELSRRSGVSRPLLSRIESEGRPSLAAETLLRLSAALGVRPEWLWCGTGMMDAAGQVVEQEVLAEAVKRSTGAYELPVIAAANAFAAGGERHTVDGWLARLDEIQAMLGPLLPARERADHVLRRGA
jgi:transcriptional regulator with XRE-family HTH domain